jgi:hypothetical protein
MMCKTGLTGRYCTKKKEEITHGAAPGKSCRSASCLPGSETLVSEKGSLCGCEEAEILEIQPSDEITMMEDMLTLAGIEGRDATTLKEHFHKASGNLKSGNSRGFEAEAELFYLEFDRLYNDESEYLFHC